MWYSYGFGLSFALLFVSLGVIGVGSWLDRFIWIRVGLSITGVGVLCFGVVLILVSVYGDGCDIGRRFCERDVGEVVK